MIKLESPIRMKLFEMIENTIKDSTQSFLINGKNEYIVRNNSFEKSVNHFRFETNAYGKFIIEKNNFFNGSGNFITDFSHSYIYSISNGNILIRENNFNEFNVNYNLFSFFNFFENIIFEKNILKNMKNGRTAINVHQNREKEMKKFGEIFIIDNLFINCSLKNIFNLTLLDIKTTISNNTFITNYQIENVIYLNILNNESLCEINENIFGTPINENIEFEGRNRPLIGINKYFKVNFTLPLITTTIGNNLNTLKIVKRSTKDNEISYENNLKSNVNIIVLMLFLFTFVKC